MAYVSGKLSTSESALSRKKAELVAQSMAIFDRELNQWLDIKLSEPRVAKRARDDPDSGVEDGGDTTPRAEARSTKKRTKREPKIAAAASDARLFVCPFYANNPAKYKSRKTCCGPGWPTAHRAREHVYRRHSPKPACRRCLEQFDSDEKLDAHQRSEEACKLNKKSHELDDVITNEQEKALRMRAKPKHSEEEKWQDMYRVIFPSARRIPSPYYEITTPKEEPEEDDEPSPSSIPSKNSVDRRYTVEFKDEGQVLECKKHIHRGLHRAVLPFIQQEVDKALRSVQTTMTQKIVPELCNNVVMQFFRTWQFSQPSSPSPSPPGSPAAISPPRGGYTPTRRSPSPPERSVTSSHRHQRQRSFDDDDDDGGNPSGCQRSPTPAASPGIVISRPERQSTIGLNMSEIMEGSPLALIDDFFANGEFDFEPFLDETVNYGGDTGSSFPNELDSAYYSSESMSSAGNGAGLGMGMGVGKGDWYD